MLNSFPSVLKVVFANSSTGAYILYSSLPRSVEEIVSNHLAYMAENEEAVTEFDRVLVEMNPAPGRVTNHFKWRATQPVRVNLKIPRFQLEMQLIRVAYPERKLDKIDLSDMVYHLRALTDCPSLIKYVGKEGIQDLREHIVNTYTRVSSVNIYIRDVVRRYSRYTNNPSICLIDDIKPLEITQ